MTTTEPRTRGSDGDRNKGAEKMATCCSSHRDWSELLAHLRRDFARRVDPVVVIRELQRAKDVVEYASLDPDDQLFVAERITRQQLDMIETGRREEARLDPQPRSARSAS